MANPTSSTINVTLTGDGTSTLSAKFHPEIELDEHFNYSCCLVEFSAHNFITNWIELVEGENKFHMKARHLLSGDVTGIIDLEPGKYELKHIADRLEEETGRFKGGHKVRLRFDRAIRRCVIETAKSVCIDFTQPDSIGRSLGFAKRTYCGEMSYVAERDIEIEHNVDIIRINCDLVADAGAFHNGISTHTLHEFQPTSVLVGFDYKVIEQPRHLVYLPVTRRRINTVIVTLTDQHNNPINFNEGTHITCLIHIKRESSSSRQ